MRIARVHSHLNGMEFLNVHQPSAWTEIQSAIEGIDAKAESAKVLSAMPYREGIGVGLRKRGWKARQKADLMPPPIVRDDLVKERVAVAIHAGEPPIDIYDLYAQHLALYVGDVIDVGIEVLPMKSMQAEMSSGPGYYEVELYNLIREGRGVPGVPLVLVGIAE